MNRDRLYAILATSLSAVAIIIVLLLCAIRFDRSTLPVPPRPTTGILPEEEFAELYTPEKMELPAEMASAAYLPDPEDSQATPAPETGTDTDNAGKAGEAASIKSSTRTSPKQVQPDETDKKTGPAEDAEKKKKEDEARRKATTDLKNAFANTKGKNNTQNTGKTNGNAGKPSGPASSQQNGNGTGRVNGGWRMPSYAKVPSTVTGTIELKAIINSQGKVTAVEVIGGQAPAATNASLAEACKAEVRRRTFTRSDNNAPESATAYITYRFN